MTRLSAIALIVFSASIASAQPKPDASALEASGNKHFELAEYDAAITDFKEAFRISDEPGYLYNIAQAYRLKNDCREAATFYKTYLRRVPNAPNAAKIRQRVAEMDKCAETQPAAPVTAPTTPTATPTSTTTTPPTTTAQVEPLEQPEQPEQDEPPQVVEGGKSWMKWSGFAAIGVGAIGAGLGVKFMLDGRSANDDLTEKCKFNCTSAEAKAIEDDGKAANRNALIFGIAGGAVLVTGVVLVVLSRNGSSHEEPAVSLQLTRGGAAAGYAWRF